ncbi:unnamed protein product [Protopolystoma xenopodis]|uniref:Uncharacterized protein n=1 Tax=Protopolystoma xenopodis TaxID=117903 RepID=A0A3S5C507_9PLAT|nr:unnamed protein product [Protopolystoma xenopodis]
MATATFSNAWSKYADLRLTQQRLSTRNPLLHSTAGQPEGSVRGSKSTRQTPGKVESETETGAEEDRSYELEEEREEAEAEDEDEEKEENEEEERVEDEARFHTGSSRPLALPRPIQLKPQLVPRAPGEPNTRVLVSSSSLMVSGRLDGPSSYVNDDT